jgi:hypothetical protein
MESQSLQFSHVISSLIDRNRVMDKDEVILKKKTKNDQKPEMEVVHIVKKVSPISSSSFVILAAPQIRCRLSEILRFLSVRQESSKDAHPQVLLAG